MTIPHEDEVLFAAIHLIYGGHDGHAYPSWGFINLVEQFRPGTKIVEVTRLWREYHAWWFDNFFRRCCQEILDEHSKQT